MNSSANLPGRMTRVLCSAVLSFEAVMMLLSILVLNGFSSVSAPVAVAIGCGMALGCLIAAGGLRRRWGHPLGHVLQVLMIAMGLLAPAVLVIGLLFAGLWIAACVIGLRIDRERAIR